MWSLYFCPLLLLSKVFHLCVVLNGFDIHLRSLFCMLYIEFKYIACFFFKPGYFCSSFSFAWSQCAIVFHHQTWRLTVICFWFPKHTISVKRRQTGLRSPVMFVVPATMAAVVILGGEAMSSTHTMIMMSHQKIFGHKMIMVKPAMFPLESNVIKAVEVLVGTPHAIQMSLVPLDHRVPQRIHPCGMTPAPCHHQGGGETLVLRDTNPQIIPVTPQATNIAPALENSPPTIKGPPVGSNRTTPRHPGNKDLLGLDRRDKVDLRVQAGKLAPSHLLMGSKAREHSCNSRHRHPLPGQGHRYLPQAQRNHS